MAVNYSDLTPGSAITWTNTGGTYAIPAKALTNTSIVQGAKSATLVDGTKGMPELLEVTVETKLQSTPAASKSLDCYVGWSSSATAGTDNPAGLGGTSTTGPNADALGLLTRVGVVPTAPSLTTGVHRKTFWVRPLKEYAIPVLDNETGQTTTNVDGETVVTVRPWYRRTPIA